MNEYTQYILCVYKILSMLSLMYVVHVVLLTCQALKSFNNTPWATSVSRSCFTISTDFLIHEKMINTITLYSLYMYMNRNSEIFSNNKIYEIHVGGRCINLCHVYGNKTDEIMYLWIYSAKGNFPNYGTLVY